MHSSLQSIVVKTVHALKDSRSECTENTMACACYTHASAVAASNAGATALEHYSGLRVRGLKVEAHAKYHSVRRTGLCYQLFVC